MIHTDQLQTHKKHLKMFKCILPSVRRAGESTAEPPACPPGRIPWLQRGEAFGIGGDAAPVGSLSEESAWMLCGAGTKITSPSGAQRGPDLPQSLSDKVPGFP